MYSNKNLLLLALLFLCFSKTHAQTAVISNISANAGETFTFKAFKINEIKGAKITPTQLNALNEAIKVCFFSESTIFEGEKEMKTAQTPTLKILEKYVEEIKKSVKQNGMGMGNTSIGYTIMYNAKGILSFEIRHDYMGAYPSSMETYICIDLKKAKILTSNLKNEDLYLNPKAKKGAMDLLTKKIQERVTAHAKTLEKDLVEELTSRKINLETLSFFINAKGINYVHVFDIPRVIQSIEPDRNYLLSWNEIKNLLKKDILIIND